MDSRLCILQLGLIFSLFLTLNIDYTNAVVFKFTNAVCESFNKSWIDFHTCRLKAVARNKILFNMNATVFVPAYRIEFRAECLKKASGYKPWLFNTTIDACRFQRKLYNQFVILLFDQLREFSNFNHTCPYVGPQIIKDFYLRTELLKNLPWPTGEYLIWEKWFFHGQHVANTKFYFEYVEDLRNRT